jgi:hypothetical protein
MLLTFFCHFSQILNFLFFAIPEKKKFDAQDVKPTKKLRKTIIVEMQHDVLT